ncbi:MAG: cold-shock protein [Anaerolineae bacterium]|nr:cold-shock protein [Anaerolineae bacterium]MCK4449921.1 cold-shock protein [Anaerolineae bacterium]
MMAIRIAMTEDHPGMFVHYSAIEGGGFCTLYEGQQVEFSVEQSPKGLQAIHVRILSPL